MRKNILAASIILFGCILLGNHLANAQTVPNFPMTFWGNVSIDGSPAPSGTIIRAYYGTSTLAGEITVQEAGIYGYTDATKQKLVVAEGSGPITFTFQEDPTDRGGETGGLTPQTYSGFGSGASENIDLAFTLPAPPPPPDQNAGGGGSVSISGGGGGGGSFFSTPTPTPTPTATSTSTSTLTATSTTGEVLGASTTDAAALINIFNNLLSQLKSLEKQLVTKQFKETSCSLVFAQNLSQGMNTLAVKNLQTALNFSSLTQIAASGAGSPGNESTYFGLATKKAVVAFQNIFSDEILAPAGLTTGNGYVGAATRAQLNILCGQ